MWANTWAWLRILIIARIILLQLCSAHLHAHQYIHVLMRSVSLYLHIIMWRGITARESLGLAFSGIFNNWTRTRSRSPCRSHCRLHPVFVVSAIVVGTNPTIWLGYQTSFNYCYISGYGRPQQCVGMGYIRKLPAGFVMRLALEWGWSSVIIIIIFLQFFFFFLILWGGSVMYMYIIEISLFVCRSCLALCLLKCSVFMFGSVCVCVCVCTLKQPRSYAQSKQSRRLEPGNETVSTILILVWIQYLPEIHFKC